REYGNASRSSCPVEQARETQLQRRKRRRRPEWPLTTPSTRPGTGPSATGRTPHRTQTGPTQTPCWACHTLLSPPSPSRRPLSTSTTTSRRTGATPRRCNTPPLWEAATRAAAAAAATRRPPWTPPARAPTVARTATGRSFRVGRCPTGTRGTSVRQILGGGRRLGLGRG
ncbi:unnamed protein product, partial [Scytosiphon promiscuus]